MARDNQISVREFTAVLRAMQRPGGHVLEMLRNHAAAPARLMTATKLATSVGYDGYRAVNLQYGNLAARIGRELRPRVRARIGTLVEMVPPRSQTNDHWQLRMKEAFAIALEKSGWLK